MALVLRQHITISTVSQLHKRMGTYSLYVSLSLCLFCVALSVPASLDISGGANQGSSKLQSKLPIAEMRSSKFSVKESMPPSLLRLMRKVLGRS